MATRLSRRAGKAQARDGPGQSGQPGQSGGSGGPGAGTLPEPWEGRCEEHGPEPETGKARRKGGPDSGFRVPGSGLAPRAVLKGSPQRGASPEPQGGTMLRLIVSINWERVFVALYWAAVATALTVIAVRGNLEVFR